MCSSLLVLLLVAVWAAHAHAYSAQESLPLDYYDDVYNRDFHIKPDSTFTFNFEQTRRDQPPHVEMREENVGRYFHREPPTTTPTSIFAMGAGSRRAHPARPAEPPADRQQQHAPLPAPPQFAFSKPQNRPLPEVHASPLWNVPAAAQDIYRQNPVENTYHRAPPAPAPSRPAQWPQASAPPRLPSIPSGYSEQRQEIRFSPSASYVSESPRAPPRAPSLRGAHKFSWDDVKSEGAQAEPERAPPARAAESARPPAAGSRPPPVPTLSPWHDNFGK